jgi:hypothetical protein
LFIASTLPEGATSRLKTSGVYYVHKMPDTKPENWEHILAHVTDPGLIGVLAKFTGYTFYLLTLPAYRDVGTRLMAAIGQQPHVMFVHESILTGEDYDYAVDAAKHARMARRRRHTPTRYPEDVLDELNEPEYIGFPHLTVNPDQRAAAMALLEQHRVTVVPYKTNAELSVLAGSFIEDHERNLLFRIYVPAGRIYAAEADKLLALFRDWLTKIKKQRVRQDGYSTASGHVYELFGDDELNSTELVAQFNDFSRFLDLCLDDPAEATRALGKMGVEPLVADDIVRRYGKETRRLTLDLRHAREARLLSIRQRLESELVDVMEDDSPEWRSIERTVDDLVPRPGDLMSAVTPSASLLPSSSATGTGGL